MAGTPSTGYPSLNSDSVIFPSTSSGTVNVNIQGISVGALAFQGGGYTLTGYQLTLGLNAGQQVIDISGTAAGSSPVTIQTPIALATAETFANDNANIGLTFGSNAVISGSAVYGYSTVNTTGVGTIALGAASTYSGGTWVGNGTLVLNNTTGSATGTGGVTIGSGAVLDDYGTISGSVTNSGTLYGNGTIAGSLSITGGSVFPGTPSNVGMLTTGAEYWTGGNLTIRVKGYSNGSYDILNASGSQIQTVYGYGNASPPTLNIDLAGLSTGGIARGAIQFGQITGANFTNNIKNANGLAVSTTPYNTGSIDITVTGNSTVKQTTTSLASTTTQAAVNQAVTFTATVAPVPPATGTPTGTVTLQVNGAPITTATAQLNKLSPDVASPSYSFTTPGTYTMTAVYAGDGTFAQSPASNSLVITVTNPNPIQQTTRTTLTSTANPSGLGQNVTFIATVPQTSGIPMGTVTFQVNGATIGTAALERVQSRRGPIGGSRFDS